MRERRHRLRLISRSVVAAPVVQPFDTPSAAMSKIVVPFPWLPGVRQRRSAGRAPSTPAALGGTNADGVSTSLETWSCRSNA